MNQKEIPSLYKKYEQFFDIGAAVNAKTIHTQKDLLRSQFNSLTAENEMKPENLQPEEGKFTFEMADQIAAFAREHNKKLRGHTLVWHNQTPKWFFENQDGKRAEKYTVLARMKEHIHTVVKRYQDDIYCWDVVNEVITDDGNELLRKSKWLEIVGPEFIEKAFEYAHDADKNALLFYNDYNECNPEKREKIYTLVKSLIEKGTPIHGVGLQAHWNLTQPDLDDIRAAIERYASLDLKLQITELDVSVYKFEDQRTNLLYPTTAILEQLAERYERLFELLREYKNVITAVTFWGAADDYTWLDDFPVRGRKNWPFLFDENHKPKKSFWKVMSF